MKVELYVSNSSLDCLTSAFSLHRDVHEHVGALLSGFKTFLLLGLPEADWQQTASVAAAQVEACGTANPSEHNR